MAYGCRFCIALYGSSGRDAALLPSARELIEQHIEATHGYLVARAGESPEQARFRFMSTYGQEPQSAEAVLVRLQDVASLVARLIEAQGPVIRVTVI